MEYGIISCIPVIVMIVGSLITKKLAPMAVISSLLAAILCYKTGFVGGYVDGFYTSFCGDTYSCIFFTLMGFGAIIELAKKSGALQGFARKLGKYANTPRKSLLITYLLQWILFADDYLLTLGSCFCMRDITDKHRIPREHMSLMGILGANNITILLAFSSWGVYNISLTKEYGYNAVEYIKTMPYMFYPIIAMVILLLLCLGLFPKIGILRQAYKRVEEGGSVIYGDKGEDLEEPEGNMGALYFFLPLLVLCVVTVPIGIEAGMGAALVTQFIMYVVIKKMKLQDFFETMFKGMATMTEIAFVILLVCVMSDISLEMGIADYLCSVVVGNVAPWLLPVMFFIAVWIVTMCSDGWVSLMLTVPIMFPMAIACDVPIALAFGAMISGSAAGVASCLFSDSMFLANAATGIPNDRELKNNAPYVGISMGLAAILYIVFGLMLC